MIARAGAPFETEKRPVVALREVIVTTHPLGAEMLGTA